MQRTCCTMPVVMETRQPSSLQVSLILYYFISVAVSAGEGQTLRQMTFSQLRERVAAIAAALSAMGVAKGDVVAGEES